MIITEKNLKRIASWVMLKKVINIANLTLWKKFLIV